MKQFFKSNIFIITTVIFIWGVMEFIFYRIAIDAQKAYEKNALTQVQFYYEDLQRKGQQRLLLDGMYLNKERIANIINTDKLKTGTIQTEKGELVELTAMLMAHILNSGFSNHFLRYKLLNENTPITNKSSELFYKKALLQFKKTKSREPLYTLNEQSRRFEYIAPLYATESCLACHTAGEKVGDLLGASAIDMDATFIIDRVDKIWHNFFFVSIFMGLFMLLVLFFVLKITHQKLRYFTQNIALEEALSAKVEKLNKVLKASGSGSWEWNIKTDEHSVDKAWLGMLGLSFSDIKNNSSDWSERIHRDDYLRVMETVQKAIREDKSYVVEFRMRHRDGHYVWIQGSGGISQRESDGSALKLSGTHQDITQRKLLEIERQNSAAYLSTLFEKNPNIIIVTDGREIIKANSAFFRFFGEYDSLEAFKKEHSCISEFFVCDDSKEFVNGSGGKWIEQVFESSEPVVKIAYKQKEYCFSVYAKKVYEHESVSIIVTFNNITETYGLKKRFEELSIMDELTQVYNRRHFNTIFLQETNRALRAQHSFSLAILDIDNFKRYNDRYGHDAGDEVLIRFATEVKKIAQRSNEFFFRLGGEEFGLIYSNYSKDEALEYAQMVCKSIEDLDIEHEENLPWKKFTVSIGVAFITPSNTLDLKSIYKKADEALYKAKESGRNRVEILD